MKIFLIRHAESVGNTNGKLTSTADFELTNKGIEQAKRLGKVLRKELEGKIIKAYSSPLLRAKQTLYEIIKCCGVNAEEVTECQDLKEMDLGLLEGMPFDKQKSCYPEIDIGSRLSSLKAPGGENYEDVKRRVKRFCEEYVADVKEEGNIIIVSHGITLRVLVNTLLDRADKDVNYLNWFENTAQTVLQYNSKGSSFIVEKLNDYAHLRELETENFKEWGFFAKQDAYITK